ncbi:substrate-binding domain-containing protein [Anabaena sp. FACHB-1237]|uniref:substrate-binding domain-containing protein n=1 Tax=Anabaena sp. FACHB-1237 TaxID=2692769 RepID=UPI001680D3BB|nr:substrate-binding domain-containing protein [Anabaena sp. FACHB-1237]MBD2137851.1 substrate-binding domain-containing protein [Anabaena sp. FACHB-1237]
MRRKQDPNHSIINLALSLVIATSPIVVNLLFNLPSYAELENTENTKSNFTVPKTMAQGTVINIDGSLNFAIVNQNLKENFEKMFSGSQVKIGINGNEDAVKSVINGTVDLAALGRKLTPEEQAQGLEQLFVRREKIAIIVAAKNPFNGKLTTEQFAKIFRGEITNWSELGGINKPLRFIDRPSNSDTRNSFQEYDIFKKSEFKTGANTTQITDDSTVEIVKQLGDDGISYVLVNQIDKLPDVKSIKIQDFTPEQEDYPFSQSFVYVYQKNPQPKIAGFLRFVASKAGQEAIAAGRQAESLAIATSTLQNTNTTSNTNTTTSNDTPPVVEQQPFNQPLTTPGILQKENAKLVFLLLMILVPGLGSLTYLWLTKKKKAATEAKSETPAIENITSLESNSELELNLTDNHTNINDTNHQDNTKITVDILEEKISFNQNHNNSNIALIDPATTLSDHQPVVEENTSELWDIEAPVVVVNNHYSQFTNIGKNGDHLNISQDELITPETSSQPENKQEYKEEQRVNNLAELLNIKPIVVNQNGHLSFSQLLGIKPTSASDCPQPLNTAFKNIVEPPITTENTEIIDLPINVNPTDVNNDASNDFSTLVQTETILSTEQPKSQPENQIQTDFTDVTEFNFSSNSKIIFTPRTPKWAYVSWYIDKDHQQALLNKGIKNLAIRLYDVTDLDLSYQKAPLVQQYNCEDAVYNCYVFIPQGEKDYVTELGYVVNNKDWLCLARSGIVRFFNRPDTDFWLFVDTELVIHGATEKGANVTVDGQEVILNDDGTFKLTVPFVDNLVDYQITATTVTGDKSKRIQKKFLQEQKES